jgi:hypothetical protein
VRPADTSGRCNQLRRARHAGPWPGQQLRTACLYYYVVRRKPLLQGETFVESDTHRVVLINGKGHANRQNHEVNSPLRFFLFSLGLLGGWGR